MKPALVLSCEHGGNRVPARWRGAFAGDAGAARALDSHRGWDRGALTLARQLARRFDAPLVACTTTRLLADPNRSRGRRGLFSEWSRRLPERERDAVLAHAWRPHRDAVTELVRAHVARRRVVLHLSVHSFTPRWQGRARTVDVGWLYDPRRPAERAFARAWLRALRARREDLRLRCNQPYRGDADGLTTALRRRFDERRYLGVELEVSQRFPDGPAAAWRRLRADLARSLEDVLGEPRAAWLPGDRPVPG